MSLTKKATKHMNLLRKERKILPRRMNLQTKRSPKVRLWEENLNTTEQLMKLRIVRRKSKVLKVCLKP